MKIKSTIVGLILSILLAPVYAQEWVYTVRPGDTLWDLVDKYSVNLIYVPKLQALNNIENPRTIKPGSQITIPVKWLKTQPAEVRISAISGRVKFKRPEGQFKKLNSVDRLQAGDEVVTDQQATVQFVFADGAQLTLRPNSRLVFDILSQYSDSGMVDTRARLQSGQVDAKIPKLIGGGSRFEIETPAATTAVRGTGYRISADPVQQTTRAEVLEGSVAVSAEGIQQVIPDGYGSVAELGKPPIPPKVLLPAPDLSDLPKTIERLPFKLDWQAIEGAESYRVQIAESNRFDLLLVDQKAEQASVKNLSLNEDGKYYLRIRGADEISLEGLDGYHQFTLNARPAPPLPMSPEPKNNIRVNNPEFRWSQPINANAYRFQLAMREDFSAVMTDEEFSGEPVFSLKKPLTPGDYYWRVATRDDSGELGPFSDVQPFSYTEPPASPQAVAPELGAKGVVFRWPENEPEDRYQIQISRKMDFSAMRVDEQLDDPVYTMEKLGSGTFYYRIATIDADGAVGQFSMPQQIKIPFAYYLEIAFGSMALLLLLL